MTRIKICGIKLRSDLEQIIQMGVDYAGIIMAPNSSRFVPFHEAMLLLKGLDKKNTRIVAVVQDMDWKEAEKIVEILPIDLIQFHGRENPEYCEKFHFPYIKVFTLEELNLINLYSTDKILIDSSVKGQRGGTGQSFDWDILKDSNLNGKEIFIAGGLNPDNIQACVDLLHPFAVDLSSGVELEPGVKDLKKIREVIQKLKLC